MADCPLIEKCPFFNDRLKGRPGMVALYKRQYCRGDNSACARHMVFRTVGREHVPADLFPNDVSRAKEVIASNR